MKEIINIQIPKTWFIDRFQNMSGRTEIVITKGHREIHIALTEGPDIKDQDILIDMIQS